MSVGPLEIAWLGRISYAEALDRQMAAVEARISGRSGDVLLLLEHPTVVTLGRSSDEANLRARPEELTARGVEIHRIARGGDVTLHAPGQLVGYLIVDLRERGAPDLHDFVRRMEGSLISALAEIGLSTRRVEGRAGVFMTRDQVPGVDRKIASIGVGVRRWVTYHGFALNVTVDLREFDVIVPCGLADVEMTSVARELGSGPLGLDARLRRVVADEFARSHA